MTLAPIDAGVERAVARVRTVRGEPHAPACRATHPRGFRQRRLARPGIAPTIGEEMRLRAEAA